MIVVFGTRLYGKVDHVPGVFYVATRFAHVQFVPLIPVGSFLIIDGTESDGEFHGVPLSLSGKSILFAWLRLALLLGGVLAVIFGIIEIVEAANHKGSWLNAVLWIAMAPLLFVAFYLSYRISRAGPERALRLAEKAGIPPEVIVEYFAPSGGAPTLQAVDSEHLAMTVEAAEFEQTAREAEPLDVQPAEDYDQRPREAR